MASSMGDDERLNAHLKWELLLQYEDNYTFEEGVECVRDNSIGKNLLVSNCCN